MKGKLKKWISILLVLALCLALMEPMGMLTKAAEEEPAYAGLEKVTLNDFALSGGDYVTGESYNNETVTHIYGDGIVTGIYSGDSLDETYFEMDIALTSNNYVPKIYYGSTEYGKGIQIFGNGAATYLHTMRPDATTYDDAGGYKQLGIDERNLWDGAFFNLKISTEWVNHDNTGANDDLKIGIYLNDALAGGSYIYYDNYEGFGNNLYIDPYYDDVRIVEPPKDLLKGLTKVNLNDFTLSGGDYVTGYSYNNETVTYIYGDSVVTGSYSGESLDGTYLDMDIALTSNNYVPNIYYGSAEDGKGIKLFGNGAATYLHTMRPDATTYDDAGGYRQLGIDNRNLWDGEFFNLKISTELVDHDGSGTKNDLQIGIYLNNILSGNSYIYYDNYEGFGNHFYIDPNYSDIRIVEPPKDLLKGLTKVTIEDFFITSGDYVTRECYKEETVTHIYGDNIVTGTYSGESLNGTYFDMDIALTSNRYMPNIYYGSTENGKGIKLFGNGAATYIHTMRPDATTYDDAGGYRQLGIDNRNLWDGEFFNLKISTELVDHDNGGTENDLQIGIYLNDVLAGGSYIYYDNYEGFGNNFYIDPYYDDIRIVGTPQDIPEPTDPFENLRRVTIEDFAISGSVAKNHPYKEKQTTYVYGDGTNITNGYYGKENATGALSLDGTYLDVDIAIQNNRPKIYYGGSEYGKGIKLFGNGEATYLHTICPDKESAYTADEGYRALSIDGKEDMLDGEFFNLKISTELVDHDGNGTENDLKIGIYLNDVLANDEYIYYDNYEYFGNNIYFDSSGDNVYFYTPEETMADDYTQLDNESYGLPDDVVESGGSASGVLPDGTDMEHTAFTTWLKYGANNADLRFAGKTNAWATLGFEFQNGSFVMLHTDSNNTSVGGFSNTFAIDAPVLNEWFRLTITTDYIDADADGEKDDVKLGVWIGETLNANRYIYLTNYKAYMGTNLIYYAEGTDTSLQYGVTNLDRITLVDFNLPDGTVITRGNTEATKIGSLQGRDSVDGTCFEVDLTFGGYRTNNTYFRYAGAGEWTGLTFAWNGSSEIEILDQTQSLSTSYDYKVGSITLDEADTDTFAKELRLRIDTEFIDLDGDGEDDVRFTIYANGNPAEVIEHENYTSHVGPYTLLYSANDSITANSVGVDKEIQDKGSESYDLTEAGYLITGTGNLSVDGVAVLAGDTLTEAGSYKVVEELPGKQINKEVILSMTGDINLDGAVNAKDLVHVKVHEDTLTGAKREAADMLGDGSVLEDDIKALRRYLVGYEVSTYGESVMPIMAYYGPYADDTNDYLTEGIFAAIAEMGIQDIVMMDMSVSIDDQSDAENIQKALRLAEEKNIGLHISDWTISGDTTSMPDYNYATKLGAYSTYSSFKGLYVTDEPSGTTFPTSGASDRTFVANAALSTRVNKYSNLLGYVNLMPFHEDSGTEEGYEGYLDEYVQLLNPKMISFDRYTFELEKPTTAESFFQNLAVVREKSVQYNLPWWGYVQAGNDFQDDGIYLKEDAPITEEEMMWQANMLLAFGCKGLQYFPLIQPQQYSNEATLGGSGVNYDRNGLIGADGEVNEWATYAKNINTSVAAVDHVLMNAISEGFMAVGTHDVNMTGYDGYLTSYKEVTSIGGNAVVGCFDYNGKTALYVVNNAVSTSILGSYDALAQSTVTLTLDGTYSLEITKGTTTETVEAVGSYALSLAAGQGALILID